ncbi:hypothetical protein ABEV74_17430 [Paenibacillus cisolokensis]|uniref:hypothetical protein n=1 Tax=Paenibacillus cisolokensis TaxID=1658519 RepID=UPI003D279284
MNMFVRSKGVRQLFSGMPQAVGVRFFVVRGFGREQAAQRRNSSKRAKPASAGAVIKPFQRIAPAARL